MARQMLLVKAALYEDERALDAWREWSVDATIENMSGGEIRLLGVGWRPLRRLGAEGPMFEVAGGVYRRTWYVNQLAAISARELIGKLNDAGIPSLAFKGLALAMLNYRDLGARSMEDLDLIVGPEHIDRAVELIRADGHELSNSISGLLGSAYELGRDGEIGVDVHAYSLIESADDSDLWEARVPLGLKDADAWAPCPADSLLLVCAHGQRWAAAQPVAWLVDAAAVIRSSDDLDWDRFAERAIARRLTGVAARSLGMLRALDVDVPADVQRRLEQQPVAPAYRLADRAARGRPTVPGIAAIAWARYRRFRELAPPEHRPSSLADWLRRSWGVTGGGAVHGGAPALPERTRRARLTVVMVRG